MKTFDNIELLNKAMAEVIVKVEREKLNRAIKQAIEDVGGTSIIQTNPEPATEIVTTRRKNLTQPSILPPVQIPPSIFENLPGLTSDARAVQINFNDPFNKALSGVANGIIATREPKWTEKGNTGKQQNTAGQEQSR